MKTITERELIKRFNNVLDDYGFMCDNICLNENGIERLYNDYTLYEGMRLQIITNNKGANVSLYEHEKLLFNDSLGIDIMKLYYMDRVRFEFLVEVIISTIYDFLEGDLDE